MLSRYDFMEESKLCYDKVGERFPDPLTVTYDDIQFTKVAELEQLSNFDIDKFWFFMHKVYERVDMDDVLLNINNVPYQGLLDDGNVLAIVDINDLLNFNSQKAR